MSCYISQYLQSEYAKVHISAGIIVSSNQLYRTIGIINAVEQVKPFDRINSYTDVVCFVLGEGPQPTVSTALAAVYPDWFIYSYDKQLQKTYLKSNIVSTYPNFMTIDCSLKSWRSGEDHGLTFNTKGNQAFNAKNVVIVAFDYFNEIPLIFKGIDPLNINMFSLQSKAKKIKDLDEMITNKYTDKNIKTKENVLKFWNFKRLYKISESNQKRWVFHLNKGEYEESE